MDSDGNITEEEQAIIEKLQKAISDGWGNGIQEYAEDTIELLEKVESSADKVNEVLQLQLDNIRNFFEKQLERTTYSLELRVKIREQDIKILDYLIGKIDKLGGSSVKTADRLAMIGDQAMEVMKNSQDTQGTINRLLELKANLDSDSIHQPWFKQVFGNDVSSEAWEEWIANGEAASKINEKLMEYQDVLIDQSNAILDYN